MKAQEDMKSNNPLTEEMMAEIKKYPLYYQPSLIKFVLKGYTPSEAYEKLKGFEAIM